MKVLLISANTVRTPYYIYPLGLDYVAKALSHQHEVKIADVNVAKKIDSITATVQEYSPDVIGISLRNIDNTDCHDARSFIPKYQELVSAIKQHTHAPIILGGSGFTIFPKELMEVLEADYGIIGEGERLPLLLNAIEAGMDPLLIPGVVTRASTVQVPLPIDIPFHRSDPDGTNAQFYISNGGMLNIQTKRGCIYNCIYCTYPHIEGKKLRLIPADEVANAAAALEQAGAKYFFITDSVFNTDFNHCVDVARAFIKKHISIPWGAFFAPTAPPEDFYRIMRNAGMTHVEFGTESLSSAMLAAYRKPFSVDDVFSAHNAALDAGLFAAHYLLMGGPGEKKDTVLETLANAEKLLKTVLFFFCGIRIYPHTEIYDIALAEGQISESTDLLEPIFFQSQYISSADIHGIIQERAAERENWFIGATERKTVRQVSRLHKQGYAGPLWEHLIR